MLLIRSAQRIGRVSHMYPRLLTSSIAVVEAQSPVLSIEHAAHQITIRRADVHSAISFERCAVGAERDRMLHENRDLLAFDGVGQCRDGRRSAGFENGAVAD